MMKKSIIVLVLLFSALCLHAQTIKKDQIKDEALPDGNLIRVHVSGRNGDTAALLQRADGVWVYINQVLYGPFDRTDVENSSPFADESSLWQFRATKDGRQVLIINGLQFGPFPSIWTPNISKDGLHWGALIKDSGGYALLVDGIQTDFFDVVFNDGQVEPPAADHHDSSSEPYFYGSGHQWVAIGYRKQSSGTGQAAGFRILTGSGEGPAYDQVAELVTHPNELSYGEMVNSSFLTADGENFMISAHQANQAPDEEYLWVNNRAYGPYRGELNSAYFASSPQVADDGSNWVITGGDKVYTKSATYPYSSPRGSISPDGSALSFAIKRDNANFNYIKGIEYGPYLDFSNTAFSFNGEHWLYYWKEAADRYWLQSESATYGPYTLINDLFYRGANWGCFVFDNGGTYVLSNGVKVAGPFQIILSDGTNPQQNYAWFYVGYQGDRLTLLINGEKRYELAGVAQSVALPSAISADGAHWALVATNPDGTKSFVDNGTLLRGLTVRSSAIVSSESKDKNALVYHDGRGHHYVAMNGAQYGPYTSAAKMVFSSVGNAWAAVAFDASGPQLILPGSSPARYENVAELKSVKGDDAVVYNGFRDNRWFPGINGISLGNFTQASIDSSSDGSRIIYLSTNEGDRRLKTYQLQIQR